MKTKYNFNGRIIGLLTTIALLIVAEFAIAQYGTRHRQRRRTAIVTATVVHNQDQQNAQQQQSQQQPSSDTQKAASSSASTTPQPESTDEKLAIGTVVSSLPEGCTATDVDNVKYYQCGVNYYRTAFQGNDLVYVTADPPK